MGNYISCTLSTAVVAQQSNGPKVIFPGGDIRQFDQPTNAAELMLETPNHFLIDSRALQIGRRFSALAADEALEMGHVYIMFPMRRLKSVIKPADMGSLLITANSAVRLATGGKARIMPGIDGPTQAAPEAKIWRENEGPRLKLDDVADELLGEFKVRMNMCRSRKPLLETITEEPVCSR